MIAQAVSPTTLAAADAELVVRALAGREDGFEELVRRYQRPIVAYVYRMVGDYDAALDLAQEVFIKVYNSLGRYLREAHREQVAHARTGDRARRATRRDRRGRPPTRPRLQRVNRAQTFAR